jgi:uncharacterized protein (TIGR03067 family)
MHGKFAIGLAVVCLLMGAAAATSTTSQDEAALQGVWQLRIGEVEGKLLSEKQIKNGKLIVNGSRYTVTLADQGTITGTQKLDASGKVKTIDIKDASGANAGKTCLGIYELKGDEFRVTFAPAGKPRPTKFATQRDSGEWMHLWKKVKE